jgi:5-methylthioadenosine/S-adenosylhomocysteine deaminase
MPNELLIKGGHVVTMDPVIGDLPTGDVLVRDGTIVDVGPNLATSDPDAEVIDAQGRLVIPGLVDTHRHVWQGAIGGFTPQVTGAGYDPAVLHGIALGCLAGPGRRDHHDRRLGAQPSVGRAR